MTVLRAIWLIAELALAGLAILFVRDRSRWLQVGCRRLLRVFDLRVIARGSVPGSGLLISNHLSYLDIIVLGALAPATFVAKRDVKSWPVFGAFARLAGTIFVDRRRRLDAAASCEEIQAALQRGELVVLFPEGTSSGGDTVLPFKSALFAPASTLNSTVTAACIQYDILEGTVADHVCYWRDMTLVPHILKLLGKRHISAFVSFCELNATHADRKALAQLAHLEILRLHEGCKVTA